MSISGAGPAANIYMKLYKNNTLITTRYSNSTTPQTFYEDIDVSIGDYFYFKGLAFYTANLYTGMHGAFPSVNNIYASSSFPFKPIR